MAALDNKKQTLSSDNNYRHGWGSSSSISARTKGGLNPPFPPETGRKTAELHRRGDPHPLEFRRRAPPAARLQGHQSRALVTAARGWRAPVTSDVTRAVTARRPWAVTSCKPAASNCMHLRTIARGPPSCRLLAAPGPGRVKTFHLSAELFCHALVSARA